MTDPQIDYKALREEIERHPGTLAYNAWSGLRRVHTILTTNQSELMAFLDNAEDDVNVAIELVQNVRASNVREHFYDELVRLMHNYAASVGTLIDHSRNLLRTYRTHSFASFVTEYDKRVANIKDEPVAVFLKDLRDYILHKEVPALWLETHLSAPAKTSVSVYAGPLLEWHGLTAGARPYLQGKETVNIKDVVREYAGVIEDLYSWLFDQFQVLHDAELRAVGDLRRRWHTGAP